LNLLLKLFGRDQLHFALIDFLGTALRLEYPHLSCFTLGRQIQALKQLVCKLGALLHGKVQSGLFEIGSRHSQMVALFV